MAAFDTTRVSDIEEQIDTSTEQRESESCISPALKAVFDELHRKTREARGTLKGADFEIHDVPCELKGEPGD